MSFPLASTLALSKSLVRSVRWRRAGRVGSGDRDPDRDRGRPTRRYRREERLLRADARALCARTRFVGWEHLDSVAHFDSQTQQAGARRGLLLPILPWGAPRLAVSLVDRFYRPTETHDLASEVEAARKRLAAGAFLAVPLPFPRGPAPLERLEASATGAAFDALAEATGAAVLVPWAELREDGGCAVTIDERPWRVVAGDLLQKSAGSDTLE